MLLFLLIPLLTQALVIHETDCDGDFCEESLKSYVRLLNPIFRSGKEDDKYIATITHRQPGMPMASLYMNVYIIGLRKIKVDDLTKEPIGSNFVIRIDLTEEDIENPSKCSHVDTDDMHISYECIFCIEYTSQTQSDPMRIFIYSMTVKIPRTQDYDYSVDDSQIYDERCGCGLIKDLEYVDSRKYIKDEEECVTKEECIEAGYLPIDSTPSICRRCTEGCAKCVLENGSGKCIACKANLFFDAEESSCKQECPKEKFHYKVPDKTNPEVELRKCVEKCNSPRYSPSNSNWCYDCKNGCDTCSTNGGCSSCIDKEKYLKDNIECVTKTACIEAGYIVIESPSRICKPCPPIDETCKGGAIGEYEVKLYKGESCTEEIAPIATVTRRESICIGVFGKDDTTKSNYFYVTVLETTYTSDFLATRTINMLNIAITKHSLDERNTRGQLYVIIPMTHIGKLEIKMVIMLTETLNSKSNIEEDPLAKGILIELSESFEVTDPPNSDSEGLNLVSLITFLWLLVAIF